MERSDIFALIDRFDASSLTSLELEEGNLRVKLGKGGVSGAAQAAVVFPPAVSACAPAEPAGGVYLHAPLVGTFYASPAPDQPPFVSVGDKVRKGQTVCMLEAMKMMSEIPAPSDCVVEEVMAQDGELVGYDAPLFRIRELSSC